MVVLTLAAVYHQILHWDMPDGGEDEKDSPSKNATEILLRRMEAWIDLALCYKHALDKAYAGEKKMVERHIRETVDIRENERKRYNQLLETEKKKRREIGIGLHFWKATASMADEEKAQMKADYEKELKVWQTSAKRFQDLYEKNEKTVEPNSPAECKICLLSAVQKVFGCGHAGCEHCVALLEHCHICRAPIQVVNSLFL